ncbi:alpha-amylase family glycosyl hydrolase [Pseudoflavitalea rhizosphaerae]|uniref:alpha-amylase family glycosyl hydrolase n=1 Tax=Pseudoflavitalea rhizosphaerae TaxID=1884793 RepID=UPI000F8C6B2C|nr:alpha-amylase family glycosyl hydrolase [Pseudoflavitalea rhizosphaerae]
MIRKKLLLFIFLLPVLPALAQLISVNPAFPKETGQIEITLDCTQGNKGLMDYANPEDIYIHIGLITSASANNGDWKHSKFDWATTPPEGKLTSLGNNRYHYTINNLRTWMGVPAGETISHIVFLFRNGSGSMKQTNANTALNGGDMYLKVYDNNQHASFIQPPYEPYFTPSLSPIQKQVGDNLPVKFAVNQASALELLFNGNSIATVASGTEITANPAITASGNQELVGKYVDGGVTKNQTINFFVSPPVTEQPLPAGVRDGINYDPADPTSVTLVLFAPNKTKATVLGDFNNWTENAAAQMFKTPDGQRFWKKITGLTSGTEYAYQFEIDNTLRIADPYTEKVLDPNNDPYIPSTTYPNLKPYPTGKTNGIVSVLQTNAPAYNWQNNNFTRPDKRNLIVYELLLRDFVAAHDWTTLKDTISYLKRLGINAIELLPFNEFEGNLSWGYNPSFYFAPDKYYGTKNALKAFIDECHKQGIAVIMDMVLNHSFGQSPMVQLYWDAANNSPAANSPWFNPSAKHPYNVGYDMNHESAATHYFVSRVTEFWLKEYKLDGFRFDLSKGFTQKNSCTTGGCSSQQEVENWSKYDASRVTIWKGYYDTIMKHNAGAFVILEHLSENSEEKELASYGMLFWGNLNYNFNEATMGWMQNSDFSWGLSTARGWDKQHLVMYMESHDEERLMYKNINYGRTNGAYNIKDLNTALKRNELGAAFGMLMPGPKMIWQFGELGYDFSINRCGDGTVKDECRTDAKPIKWDYQTVPARKNLYDVYARVLGLRQHFLYKDVFAGGVLEKDFSTGFKWMKIATDTSSLVVVGNFEVSQQTAGVSFPRTGTWYEYFGGQPLIVSGSAQSITLQPGEYRIYINRNIASNPTPVPEIPTINQNFRLVVYPNPVSRSGQIEFELPAGSSVSLSLTNIYGQRIADLYSGVRAKGVHRIPLGTTGFEWGKLPKGMYFLQLLMGDKKLVRPLMVE